MNKVNINDQAILPEPQARDHKEINTKVKEQPVVPKKTKSKVKEPPIVPASQMTKDQLENIKESILRHKQDYQKSEDLPIQSSQHTHENVYDKLPTTTTTTTTINTTTTNSSLEKGIK